MFRVLLASTLALSVWGSTVAYAGNSISYIHIKVNADYRITNPLKKFYVTASCPASHPYLIEYQRNTRPPKSTLWKTSVVCHDYSYVTFIFVPWTMKDLEGTIPVLLTCAANPSISKDFEKFPWEKTDGYEGRYICPGGGIY